MNQTEQDDGFTTHINSLAVYKCLLYWFKKKKYWPKLLPNINTSWLHVRLKGNV